MNSEISFKIYWKVFVRKMHANYLIEEGQEPVDDENKTLNIE